MDEQGFVAALREEIEWAKRRIAMTDAEQFEHLFDRVKSLELNWEGDGDSEEILMVARHFIGRIPSDEMPDLPMVYSEHGVLLFGWANWSGRRSLEMELRSPSKIHYNRHDGEECVEIDGAFDINDIDAAVSLLRWIYVRETRRHPKNPVQLPRTF